jgi:hypothetical protein
VKKSVAGNVVRQMIGSFFFVSAAPMWQPNRAQWSILWTVAVLLVLVWPPDRGRSLVVKTVNWAADPTGSLPTLPAPLPMAMADDRESGERSVRSVDGTAVVESLQLNGSC